MALSCSTRLLNSCSTRLGANINITDHIARRRPEPLVCNRSKPKMSVQTDHGILVVKPTFTSLSFAPERKRRLTSTSAFVSPDHSSKIPAPDRGEDVDDNSSNVKRRLLRMLRQHVTGTGSQMLELITSLIISFINHMEFLIHPKLDGGFDAGIRWNVAWEKTIFELPGKGFSFHTHHTYAGRAMIRNMQNFLGPAMLISEYPRKQVCCVISLLTFAAFVYLFRFAF